VAQLLLLLLLSCVEGHLLGHVVLVSNGELTDQVWVPKFLLEEHNNKLVVDIRDDVSPIAKSLDELLEGLSRLLDDAG
jgi:hypothetical protein